MSVEGTHVTPESAAGVREKEQGPEQGANSETDAGIPDWSVNVQIYDVLQEGHCTYNAEEQSLVWPPMLLICSFNNRPDADLECDIMWLRDKLAKEGVLANSVAETKHVCCEGIRSYHLFVLPPSGLAFAAAKAVDSAKRDFDVFYPSLKDIFDIKNGRVPEFYRRFVLGLKFHGRPREAWMDLAVDLVRDDGICVGRGVCQKHEAMDCVDEEPLGEYHVGVQVLEVLDYLLPYSLTGSVLRWRTTHVLCNGVSLFECLRQHLLDGPKDRFCEVGSDSAGIAGVLKDQCISSVSPWTGISKDLIEFDHLPSKYATTCRKVIGDIDNITRKSDNECPSLHDGELFSTKLGKDESLRTDDIKKIAKDTSKKRLWMKHLSTINSSHLARDVVKRLTVLQKLNAHAKSSTLVSSMIEEARRMEIDILNSIEERVQHENKRKMEIADFDKEMESFILQRRREQHKQLLQELTNVNARHLSVVDGLVLGKFKFLDNAGEDMKETESMQQWLAHHTAKATDKEKKKWEKQAAKARMQAQKKLREQAAKTRMEEQRKWEKQLAKARKDHLKRLEEQVAKARMEEQKKWVEQALRVCTEERKKCAEQLAKARLEEQKKCEEISAKVMTELAVARQELAEQKEAMPKCAICFEALEEGTGAKCGEKRSRDDVVQRKRACFTPCMHSGMCLDCAVAAWEKFKRCPVCSSPCSSTPQPIFT